MERLTETGRASSEAASAAQASMSRLEGERAALAAQLDEERQQAAQDSRECVIGGVGTTVSCQVSGVVV